MNSSTQSEQLQQQLDEIKQHLLQSQKMITLGSMTTDIVHELNNPIGYIKNNLLALQDYMNTLLPVISTCLDYAHNAKNKELKNRIQSITSGEDINFIMTDIKPLLEDAVKGSGDLSNIITPLKQIAQTDNANGQLFDLNLCIRNTLQIVKNELKYKTTVQQNLEPIPLVQGSPKEINQVIMNILLNAVQAISETGEISISTHTSSDTVILRISDTGRGIAKKDQKKIFNPFFTTHKNNTGLGLYICNEIIQAHQGCIKVESEVASGTTFIISLPLAKAETDPVV
ncbi:MAG: ATP-binding protein [Pseudomonadota bacterium]